MREVYLAYSVSPCRVTDGKRRDSDGTRPDRGDMWFTYVRDALTAVHTRCFETTASRATAAATADSFACYGAGFVRQPPTTVATKPSPDPSAGGEVSRPSAISRHRGRHDDFARCRRAPILRSRRRLDRPITAPPWPNRVVLHLVVAGDTPPIDDCEHRCGRNHRHSAHHWERRATTGRRLGRWTSTTYSTSS